LREAAFADPVRPARPVSLTAHQDRRKPSALLRATPLDNEGRPVSWHRSDLGRLHPYSLPHGAAAAEIRAVFAEGFRRGCLNVRRETDVADRAAGRWRISPVRDW
jgi:hypothetical protein